MIAKIFFSFQQFPIVFDISEYYNSFDKNISSYVPTGKDEAAMSAVDELVKILLNFTPEQLKQFLDDPVTRSVLQLEEEAEPDLLEVS